MSQPLSTIAVARQEDWWQLRHQQKCQEVKQVNHAAKIVFLGDSITHAWEVEGEQAWQQHFAAKNAINLGFSGDRTEHLLWRIQNGELDELSPDWVIILIGTNNPGHRHDSPEHTAAAIELILKEITTRLPNSKIILMAIFPRSRNQKKRMRKAVDATNGLIRHFCNRQQVLWLNINHNFLTSDGVLLESVMPDLLHPNSAQYSIWAKEIIKLTDG
ncbi:GDSL-type esterase/lipase family protein [Paraglaciecola sp. 2405UD69-4]|uniref:GDSL-type esterase/lipase family protein n=1 Tax=Paraglaciecola sp. 2405UD69-4 TaxID=3391836 RepID=UPI0039C9A878